MARRPTADSTLYTKPLVVDGHDPSAGRGLSRRACRLPGIGRLVRADGTDAAGAGCFLGDLKPIRNVGFGHTYGGNVRYSGNTQPPQKDKSNLGQELKINRQTYQHGMGVHAPCALMYEIKPEYKRFVALAGADENLVSISNGSNLAKYPSVVFKVFIDGQEAAASPVMRVLSPAWRFDVAIPDGARTDQPRRDGCRRRFARGFRRLGQRRVHRQAMMVNLTKTGIRTTQTQRTRRPESFSISATCVLRVFSQLFVELPNPFGPVFRLQPFHDEMTPRHVLEVIDKKNVDNASTGGTHDWNSFRGDLFGNNNSKSRGDSSNESNDDRRAFLDHSSFEDEGGGPNPMRPTIMNCGRIVLWTWVPRSIG